MTRDVLAAAVRKECNGSGDNGSQSEPPQDSARWEWSVADDYRRRSSLDDVIELLQQTLKSAKKARAGNLDVKTWAAVMRDRAKGGLHVLETEEKDSRDLDRPLLRWSAADVFSKRDLLRSICVQGASGSGKTNFVGWHLANALAADRDIGGVILASKPVEDAALLAERFARAGRQKRPACIRTGACFTLQSPWITN